MSVAAKICGLIDREALHAAIEAGASFLGFVFVPASKRAITPKEARDLLATLPHPALCRFQTAVSTIEETEALVLTALFVDPTDEEVLAVLDHLRPFLGLIQLHGNETPTRVTEIKKLSSLPVMKAIAIASAQDFASVKDYEAVCDMLLFDTKVEKGLPGGTGKSFDWTLLKDQTFTKPWMLAGGLDAKNVRKAIEQSGARIVDCSSGVETKGKKDPDKIRAFLKLCHEN